MTTSKNIKKTFGSYILLEQTENFSLLLFTFKIKL
jgi:hypothetical protein